MKILKNHSLNKTDLLLKGLVLFFFTTILHSSCSKKEEPVTNSSINPPPLPPSLSGQEFLFDSLTWIFLDGRFDVGVDEIYLQTPARPDLFPWFTYSTYLNAEVLLKFDTASNWIEVTSADINDPAIPFQYQYWVNLRSLFVHMHPLNYQLIGRKAAIKIKFL